MGTAGVGQDAMGGGGRMGAGIIAAADSHFGYKQHANGILSTQFRLR